MEQPTQPAKALKRAFDIFRYDLEALPEDAINKSFGGKTRTVADIVFEVNLVNDHVGMVIRGEVPFKWPEGGWIKAPAEFNSKEAVLDAFNKSAEKLTKTANSYSQSQMEEPIQTEDGQTTRGERCRFMTLHLWYHSGQLNFIQTMLGDDEWHWK